MIQWYEALLSSPGRFAREAAGCIFPGVPSLSLSGGEFVMPTAGPERGHIKFVGAERSPSEAQRMLALVYTQLLDECIGASGDGFACRAARGERVELVCHVLEGLGCEPVMSTPRAWYWRSADAWVVVRFMDLLGRVRIDSTARSDQQAEALLERVSCAPEAARMGLTRMGAGVT